MSTLKRVNKKKIVEKLKRWCRYAYLKTIRMKDPPEKIALGAAIGSFIGILPTLGLSMTLAFIMAYFFRANKTSALLGTFVMNPVTTPILWSLSITIGGLLFWQDAASILTLGVSTNDPSIGIGQATVAFMTGNAIVALVFSVVIYYFVKNAVIKHRVRKAARFEKGRMAREKLTRDRVGEKKG